MATEPLDLLIVGAGPAGLLSSIIASKLGLTHRVVEARSGLHPEPSAHVLKTHTMEVYRRVGAEDAIAAAATPVELQRCVTWCDSVSGLIYGQLDLTGLKGKVSRFTDISPTYSANLPQSLLEPILHQRGIEVAGGDLVSFNLSFKGFEDSESVVTSTLGGPLGDVQVRSRYVIGADGARSSVRRSAGIDFEGPRVLANFLAIHIRSDVRRLLKRAPGVLFFVRRQDQEGFFIMHQAVGSQVFMLRFDPALTPFESFDEMRCSAIIRDALGCEHDFEVAAIDQWAMSAQIATEYRKGRVLLVGDAAHRFPPTGGLGLNTGVEDVENLIWKLAAVLRGKADAKLLDTHTVETRPIAVRNTNQSVNNHRRMKDIDTAIGLDQPVAIFNEIKRSMLANPQHERFAAIDAAILSQIDHFASLELDMAANAEFGAFLPAEREICCPVPAREGYQPSFKPGNYIPHLWVEPGVSTIDKLRFDRFVLFSPADSAHEWTSIAAQLSPQLLAVEVVVLAKNTRGPLASAEQFWGAIPFAVLVRPDGRIGWVEPDNCADRFASLNRAVRLITFPSPSTAPLPEMVSA